MDKLHTTMVSTCDRLLLLLTGPDAVTDPAEAEAALRAIELLQVLEARLKGGADAEAIDPAVFLPFLRQARVSSHVAEVFGVLNEESPGNSDWAARRH